MQFTDMLGSIKAVEIPASRIEDVLDKEIMFDGSSIEGFVRIKEADMYLHPDWNTFLLLPFEDSSRGSVARFICDVYMPDGTTYEYTTPKIRSRNLHGTGCTLSSAIASYLALGCTLPDAVAQAKDYITSAILRSVDIHIGHGNGPLV